MSPSLSAGSNERYPGPRLPCVSEANYAGSKDCDFGETADRAGDAAEDQGIDKLLIASIGVEGGGADIYGSREHGVWSFWTEGRSMDLDENEGDVWRSWSSKLVARLEDALPKDWPLFYPIEIHPNFVGWFRKAYEPVRARLRDNMQGYQSESPHERWTSLLGLGDRGAEGSN